MFGEGVAGFLRMHSSHRTSPALKNKITAPNVKNCAGMRGDFLGQASVAWNDLEIGRELNLALVRREGVQTGSVTGTIKLLVGEPVVEVAREDQQVVSETSTLTTGAAGATDIAEKYEHVAHDVPIERKEVSW